MLLLISRDKISTPYLLLLIVLHQQFTWFTLFASPFMYIMYLYKNTEFRLTGYQILHLWNLLGTLTGQFIQARNFIQVELVFYSYPEQFSSQVNIIIGFWSQPEIIRNKGYYEEILKKWPKWLNARLKNSWWWWSCGFFSWQIWRVVRTWLLDGSVLLAMDVSWIFHQ